MSRELSGMAGPVGTVVTLILLGVGAAMWSGAPTPADEAVGKGLVTLGTCAAVVALALILHAASMEPRTEPREEQRGEPTGEPGRSDWDDV